MSREEEIGYMADCINNFEKFCNSRSNLGMEMCDDCKYHGICFSGNTGYVHSVVLYDNGCRKAEEVHKEVVEEVLTKILYLLEEEKQEISDFPSSHFTGVSRGMEGMARGLDRAITLVKTIASNYNINQVS